jgi:hypothetical protein
LERRQLACPFQRSEERMSFFSLNLASDSGGVFASCYAPSEQQATCAPVKSFILFTLITHRLHIIFSAIDEQVEKRIVDIPEN